MHPLQELNERPEIVSREYVIRLLACIFGYWPPGIPTPQWLEQLAQMGGAKRRACPEHLLDAWLDYLEKKGVVLRDGDSYVLPGTPDALAEIPEEAQRSLHAAIVQHCRSGDCPRLLGYCIPVFMLGGTGSASQSGNMIGRGSAVSGPISNPKDHVRELRWDRKRHVVELADFGPHAEVVFDWILERLTERSSSSGPTQAQRLQQEREQSLQRQEERARLAEQQREARRQDVDQAIASADVRRLADFWHSAAERICAGIGPMDENFHVLWKTSIKLAVAGEKFDRPRASLMALRGAMIGAVGSCDSGERFATDPTVVELRTRAAAEIAGLLVFLELADGGDALRPATHDNLHPCPPTPAEPDMPTVLMPRQLPAMIVVTLLAHRGEMRKCDLKDLPGVRDLDRGNLANLLTPKGDLAMRDLIKSLGRTVRLTEKGRNEAIAQKLLNTKSLDHAQEHGAGSGNSGDSG